MGVEDSQQSLASIASSLEKIHNLLADIAGQPPHAAEPEYVPPTDETPPYPTDEEPAPPPGSPKSTRHAPDPTLPPPPTGVQ